MTTTQSGAGALPFQAQPAATAAIQPTRRRSGIPRGPRSSGPVSRVVFAILLVVLLLLWVQSCQEDQKREEEAAAG